MHTRTDRLSAILIDAVVRNYRSQGVRCAADALARNGIALEVALRVLTRPWQRRRLQTARLEAVHQLVRNGPATLAAERATPTST